LELHCDSWPGSETSPRTLHRPRLALTLALAVAQSCVTALIPASVDQPILPHHTRIATGPASVPRAILATRCRVTPVLNLPTGSADATLEAVPPFPTTLRGGHRPAADPPRVARPTLDAPPRLAPSPPKPTRPLAIATRRCPRDPAVDPMSGVRDFRRAAAIPAVTAG
jgi:hypothetical protein